MLGSIYIELLAVAIVVEGLSRNASTANWFNSINIQHNDEISLAANIEFNQTSLVPYFVECPNRSIARRANNILGKDEMSYIKERQPVLENRLLQYLKDGSMSGYDFAMLIRYLKRVPVIAFAISGGGYRSMLTGTGFLMAFDARTPNATLLGGILESSSYIVGISDGAWAIVWLLSNDFLPLYQLLFEDADLSEQLMFGIPEIDVKMEKNLLNQPGASTNILSTLGSMFSPETPEALVSSNKVYDLSNKGNKLRRVLEFYTRLHQEVGAKKRQGWYTSFTDYWARALCNQLFSKRPQTIKTLSSVEELGSFAHRQIPFPLINAIQKQPASTSRNFLMSHYLEINPYEFGSWESYLDGFIQTKYLGSNLTNGRPVSCVNGYDNTCFVAATSSSLFNEVSLVIFKLLVGAKSEMGKAIEILLSLFGLNRHSLGTLTPSGHSDHAILSPNPFYRWESACQAIRENPHLYLVDGGDDGQNVPFGLLLQPCRQVDIVFAIDSSSDVDGYPNGTTLIHTAQRLHNPKPYFDQPVFEFKGVVRSYFPRVPCLEESTEPAVFDRAMFLGCDVERDYPEVKHNKTVRSTSRNLPPIIVYYANREESCPSNTLTFKLSYNQTEKQCLMTNGFNIATQRNLTSFANCIKCATFKRHFDRIELGWTSSHTSNDIVPRICKACFSKYCWRKPTKSQ